MVVFNYGKFDYAEVDTEKNNLDPRFRHFKIRGYKIKNVEFVNANGGVDFLIRRRARQGGHIVPVRDPANPAGSDHMIMSIITQGRIWESVIAGYYRVQELRQTLIQNVGWDQAKDAEVLAAAREGRRALRDALLKNPATIPANPDDPDSADMTWFKKKANATVKAIKKINLQAGFLRREANRLDAAGQLLWKRCDPKFESLDEELYAIVNVQQVAALGYADMIMA